MRVHQFLGLLAVGTFALASGSAMAGPTILAETSTVFGPSTFSSSDGPVTGSNPGFYSAASETIDPLLNTFVASSGFVDDGVADFFTIAIVGPVDTGFSLPGGGGAAATSTFTLSETLTNTGPSADSAFFSFFIEGWGIALEPSVSFSEAKISAEIFVEGEPIWAVTAGLESTGGVLTPFLTGFGPGGLPSQTCFFGSCLSDGPYSGLIDLGILASGESISYSYILTSSIFMTDATEEISALAAVTDPSEASFAGLGSPSGSSVPAPGALLIVGFGLIGLAITRRRSATVH